MTKKTDVLSELEVRNSAIHGRGVFAACDIPAGSRIGRYGGRRFASDDDYGHVGGSGPTYIFGLSDGSLIDGARGGNATRFINHSCAPNCLAIEVETPRGLNIVIEALNRIPEGDELFLDYALQVTGPDEGYACRCGTPACRGTMVAAAGV